MSSSICGNIGHNTPKARQGWTKGGIVERGQEADLSAAKRAKASAAGGVLG
jgi:hypothetical protein